VAAEVALSMVLLAGSGLVLKSLWQVLSVDPGFDPEQVVAATVHPPASQYPGGDERRAFYDSLLAGLSAAPGVGSVGMISNLPLAGGGSNGRIDIEAGPAPYTDAEYRVTDGRYFSTLGIPLLAGRTFDTRDDAAAPHVAMVNRALAEAAWPGESPIGKRLTGGGMDSYWDQEKYATVIGVVGDVRQSDLTTPDEPTVYFPYSQRPQRTWVASAVVRLDGEAGGNPLARASSALANATLPRMAGRMLLKSCAMPPARVPIDSIFCASRSWRSRAWRSFSRRLRSVMSRCTATMWRGRPSWPASGMISMSTQ
jgi:hypothetical protein